MHRLLIPLLFFLTLTGATHAGQRSMDVTVTAYTSSVRETDSTPNLAAWNNELEPGMNAVAVSRDLIPEGLTDGTEVAVEGFEENFTVLDKMNRRHQRRIDIYMGNDRQAAREFGKQRLKIWWYE